MNLPFGLNSLKTLRGKFLYCVLPPVLGCFFLFSLIFSILSYQDRKESILASLDEYAQTQSIILAKSLWEMDFSAVKIQLDSLLQLPDISAALVVEPTSKTRIERGSVGGKKLQEKYFLIHKPIIFESLTGKQQVGELTLTSLKANIYYSLFDAFSRDSLLLFLMVAVIVASAVAANRLIIDKPIKLLITAIQKADEKGIRKQIDYHVQDEIGRVIKAYNSLLVSLDTAEADLRESEEKFRNVVERANDGIAIYQDDMFIYANPKAASIVGYSVEEALALPLEKVVHQDELQKVLERIKRRLAGEDVPQVNETVLYHKDGHEVEVEINAGLMTLKDKASVLFFIRDISERKVAEKEKELMKVKLHQAQKMESIGLMAGGVAHDLNNILSGITGYPELILHDLPSDSKLRKPIEVIHDSGKRAATVVSDLLTVARGAASIRELHNLNALIQEYLDSPEYEKLKSHYPLVVCQYQLTAAKPTISCSPVHVKKCLMNLITNAAEAVSDNGTVMISTSNQNIDATELDLSEGVYVVVSVQDTGSGIAGEELDHIFEPFYTKKVMGRSGTGLGLTVVWNTMEDHDGKVTVKSNEKGTCFRLYFPLSPEAETEPSSIEDVNIISSDNKYILVVDDEPHLRDLASQMLRSLGYKVDVVSSGEDAIQFVKNTKVDLILLDMLMEPGINGRQTYEEIRKLYPDQKAVIASGFSESDDVKEAIRFGAGGFIKKPYSIKTLGRAIKQALTA